MLHMKGGQTSGQHEVTADESLVPCSLVLKERQLRCSLLRAGRCIHAVWLIYLGVYVQQQSVHIREGTLHMCMHVALSSHRNALLLTTIKDDHICSEICFKSSFRHLRIDVE